MGRKEIPEDISEVKKIKRKRDSLSKEAGLRFQAETGAVEQPKDIKKDSRKAKRPSKKTSERKPPLDVNAAMADMLKKIAEEKKPEETPVEETQVEPPKGEPSESQLPVVEKKPEPEMPTTVSAENKPPVVEEKKLDEDLEKKITVAPSTEKKKGAGDDSVRPVIRLPKFSDIGSETTKAELSLSAKGKFRPQDNILLKESDGKKTVEVLKGEKIERIGRSREAAEYTLYRAEQDDLNADSLTEGHEKFAEKSREFWKKFATHGYHKFENGQPVLVKKPDLDGKAFLKLMELAGMDVSGSQILDPEGDPLKDGITGDMTKDHGVTLINDGEGLVINDEGVESTRGDSTTKFAYEILTDLGLLKAETYLEKFVEFVTLEDCKGYDISKLKELISEKYKLSRTVAGLYQYMDMETILALFKRGKNYDDELTKGELKKLQGSDPSTGRLMALEDASDRVKDSMDRSEKSVRMMREDGFEIDSKGTYGKILVDLGHLRIGPGGEEKISANVPLGEEVYRVMGGNTYVLYVPEHNRFKIFTDKEIDFKFDCGFPVRGYFWNKPPAHEGMVSLEEILKKLGVRDEQMGGALKEAREKEEERRKNLRDTMKEIGDVTGRVLESLDRIIFSKAVFSEEIIKDAEDLKKSAEDLAGGRAGKKKEFDNWEGKLAQLRQKEKEVKQFLKKAESTKKLTQEEIDSRAEQSRKEILLIEKYYLELAKDYLLGIEDFYKEEKGYTREDVEKAKETFWKTGVYDILKKEDQDYFSIRGMKLSEAVGMIKEKLGIVSEKK